MSYVFILVAPESGSPLSVKDLNRISERLADLNLSPGIAICLSREKAYEWPVQTDKPVTAKAALVEAFGQEPLDWALIPEAHRQKKLLIADMDSTIITVECINELADFAGFKDQVAEITERAMNGELEFESALRERVALLKGTPVSVLEEVFKDRINLTPGARTLVQTMKANGATTALISGGFTFFTERVAAACGFDTHQGNALLEDAGTLSGEVGDPILGREAKLAALRQLRGDKNLMVEETLAVGDGANDLAMINEAGLGVAFHAKPIIASAAEVGVHYTDLTSLLFFQGYNRDAFVTS